ncbi:hypothetical protein CVT26_010947 [Gymnopilus dilepis]|uniref:BTB domain-containing protein n=1 Tax=Gymnopilus dilepis TaxID=231916 RepID=A0A409VJ43_9AGAR|nr:hypothetical protein CVT26_010947 [Gymnopilus dilepis]
MPYDEDDCHPAKKPRLDQDEDENDSQSASCPSRSEYWFKTGDVVLQAENTQFRVHREILSRHSRVFTDTFGMPQSKEGEGSCSERLVDGQPLVDLDDPVHEIDYMLSILYDTLRMHDWTKPMTVIRISTLLRLGKKYEIDFFVQEALQRLCFDHPTTLAAWESVSAHGFYVRIGPVDNLAKDMVTIINLANEHSIPSILPAAYLHLCMHFTLVN